VIRLILFHDAEALRWSPFIETRPVGEMLYGTSTLRARAERSLGTEARAYTGAQHLEGFDEPGSLPHLDPNAATDDDRIFLCVRAAINPPAAPLPDRPATLYIGSQVVGWVVPAGEHGPGQDARRDLRAGAGERIELQGELLGRPWDLMARNPARITADAGVDTSGNNAFQLTDVPVLGNHRVILGGDATVEPGVILDARAGPVWLDRDTRVEGPARITGPLYLGAGSTILGGSVRGSSIGPGCKVRGEVAASVILGYCNKTHDGYLGHSVLGRWVNLGAGTINSDLKNTYSTVRVTLPTEEVDTGMVKVGGFLGDHVKTGIGTLINTGTVVGAGSNLFGGKMPPAYVPLFSWGEGENLVEYRLDRFLDIAQAVMNRRDVELTEGMRELLGRAFEKSQIDRSNLKGRS
jgi:UDP-N-acetylglucosamine diphosphorylase/glucosamine-1-phosphate N-acetyltransferase